MKKKIKIEITFYSKLNRKENTYMSREFCCSKCGLIWFDEKMNSNEVICPECKNMSNEYAIYPCDNTGWFYISDSVVKDLHERRLKIHYHKKHPWYGSEG